MSTNYITSVTFCDDLRSEVSGKEIAIGVYSGGINVAHTPFAVSHFVIRFEVFTDGKSVPTFMASMRDPTGNRLFEQTVQLQVQDWNLPASVAIGGVGMIFPVPGKYTVDVNFDDGWVPVRDFYVNRLSSEEMRQHAQDRMAAIARFMQPT